MFGAKTKKISAIVIIIGGIIGAYFIIKDAVPEVNFQSKKSDQSESVKLSDSISGSVFEKISNSVSSDKMFSVRAENYNLTQALGESFFNKINTNGVIDQAKINPTFGINTFSGQVLSDVVQKGRTDLSLITTIDSKLLKISWDNSVTAKKKYLNEIDAIIKNDFGTFNKNYLEVILDTYKKLDSSSAIRMAGIYGKLADDFLNVSVPSGWVDLHKEIIVYYKNSETVYSAMAMYQVDPMKGYLALDAIEIVVGQAPKIQDDINKKAKEVAK